MKYALTLFALGIFYCTAVAQFGVKYEPSIQITKDLQYFRPKGNLYVGDCMPFYQNNTFSYYWLLDSAHHKSLKGLGGHQWVLSRTTDLKNWKQYPIVLGIDEEWEKSICTGSIVFYNKKYYAFYASRLIANGAVNEQLSYAISKDGIHFEKQKPNPFYTSAAGYSHRNFRDPKVFVEPSGEFHLFVSSEQQNPVLKNAAGCLVHLSSRDLKTWTVHPPVLTGQGSVPECPDYFKWNAWYYLVYSDNSNTFYVKSRKPYGPWEEPHNQALNEEFSNVVKTAEFKNNRRIAAGWIPARLDDKDNGHEIFGGNSVFRELGQEADGTLSSRFPPEMIPPSERALQLNLTRDSTSGAASTLGASKQVDPDHFLIQSSNGIDAVHFESVPENCKISFEVEGQNLNEELGLYLRSTEHALGGYLLSFSAINQRVSLGNTSIHAVTGLDKSFKVEIIMKGSIIDVCVDGRRCVVNRVHEQKGNFLWFYVKHGVVDIRNLKISALQASI